MESNKKPVVVYLVQHSYKIGEYDETKIIGIYSTKEKAKEVVEEYKTLLGFKDYPNDFYIDKYELDKNHWCEGFIKSSEAEAYVIEETIMLSYLKQSMKNNKIVSIFSDINETNDCTIGFVSAISSEQVLIKKVTDDGLNDGYVVLKLENVYNINIDWHYQRKLERLYELQNQNHREIPIIGLIEPVDLFKEILKISKKFEMLVNVNIYDTETEEENIGLIKKLNDAEVVILRILEDGNEDGESVILIHDIYKLNCDSYKERCSQLLFKNYKKL